MSCIFESDGVKARGIFLESPLIKPFEEVSGKSSPLENEMTPVVRLWVRRERKENVRLSETFFTRCPICLNEWKLEIF